MPEQDLGPGRKHDGFIWIQGRIQLGEHPEVVMKCKVSARMFTRIPDFKEHFTRSPMIIRRILKRVVFVGEQRALRSQRVGWAMDSSVSSAPGLKASTVKFTVIRSTAPLHNPFNGSKQCQVVFQVLPLPHYIPVAVSTLHSLPRLRSTPATLRFLSRPRPSGVYSRAPGCSSRFTIYL